MFVVDGVELVVRYQLEQMRKFERDNAVIAENPFDALREIEDIRYVREHIITDDQIGGRAPLPNVPGQ